MQLDKSHQSNDEHVPMLSRSAVLLRRGMADYATAPGELHEAGSIGHLLNGRPHETSFTTDVHPVEIVSASDACASQQQQCDCIAAIQPVLSHYATRESMRTYDSPQRAAQQQRYIRAVNAKNVAIYGELPRQGMPSDTYGMVQPMHHAPQQQHNTGSDMLPDPDLVTVTLYSSNSGVPKRQNGNGSGNGASVKTDNESNSLREMKASTFAKS